MHCELHGNVVHHGVELLLLVSMLFLLAIPKSHLILKELLYTSLYSFCISVTVDEQVSQLKRMLRWCSHYSRNDSSGDSHGDGTKHCCSHLFLP